MYKKVVSIGSPATEKNEDHTAASHISMNTNPVLSSVHEIPLSELLTTIIKSWRLIAATILLSLLGGIFYVKAVSPVYRTDVLLQIEQKQQGIGALADLSQLLQEEAPVSAEFEILRSRMVLGSAVDNLKLNIETRPIYLPLLGSFIALQHTSENIAKPWLGMKKYAWGGERIKVDSFDLPDEYLNVVFTLVAGRDGEYELYQDKNALITKGEVGDPVNISLAEGGTMTLFVSELKGRVGTQFELVKKPHLSAIAELKENLKITELGKQSGILQLSLEGTDRGRIATVLNEIANIYLRQSVERKSAEAEKTLEFLEKQLPLIKEKMEDAEAALNSYRLRKGSVDLPLETQATLEKIVSIDSQLSQLKRDREELIRRFTPQHPRIAALDAQIGTLNAELKEVDLKVKGLPNTQQEILRLTRDADVSRSLYTTLANSAQELKVVKAGAIGNVRIVDYAVKPIYPVKPNKGVVFALTFVLGTLLGVALALIRKSLNAAVQDPEIIERKLGLPVYATIPYSRQQKELKGNSEQLAERPAVLAVTSPQDWAIESIRSLRTSLYFSQLNFKNNVLSMTSPSPDEGKSFVCLNLAAVLAGADKRVLVIDADLRKGRLHECFGMSDEIDGLSDVIANVEASDTEFSQVIRKTGINNLDLIPAGTKPSNPSELLLHSKFALALEIFAGDYDHVIIDSPPILAATDAAIIGNLAGATLLVVKDAQNPLREIATSVKQLKQAGVNLRGVVYNGVKISNSRYGQGKYYAYYYSNKKK